MHHCATTRPDCRPILGWPTPHEGDGVGSDPADLPKLLGAHQGLAFAGGHPSFGGRSLARVPRRVPIIVGVQSVHRRIKAVVGRLVPAERTAVRPVEEVGAVDSRGVAVAARVRSVNRRLPVGVILGTRLRDTVATLRLQIPLVRRVDHRAQPRVASISDRVTTVRCGVSLVGDAVAQIGGLVTRVGDGVPFVGHARPPVGIRKTLFHDDQGYDH